MPDAYANADEVSTSLGIDDDDQGRLSLRRKLWMPGEDPGVILCNGFSRRAHHMVGGNSLDASTRYMAASVARRHMTVATHDFCFEYSAGVYVDGWGNPEVVTTVGQTHDWLQGTNPDDGQAASGKVSLIGISMGATAALNYALSLGENASDQIASIALISPALDTEDIEGTPRDAFLQASLRYAYGGSAATFAVEGVLHNPMRLRSEIAAMRIPIHIWYSSDDPIALTAITESFIETTDYVRGTVTGAYGHSIDDFPMDDIASWLERGLN